MLRSEHHLSSKYFRKLSIFSDLFIHFIINKWIELLKMFSLGNVCIRHMSVRIVCLLFAFGIDLICESTFRIIWAQHVIRFFKLKTALNPFVIAPASSATRISGLNSIFTWDALFCNEQNVNSKSECCSLIETPRPNWWNFLSRSVDPTVRTGKSSWISL